MRRWLTASVALALVTAVGTGPTALAAPAGAGMGLANPWAAQMENPNANVNAVPLAQALSDAKNFNYIIAHVVAYQGKAAQMRAANPRLKLLVYMNATFAQSYEANSYPEADYAHTASGARVVNPATGNFMMNPNNPDWVRSRQNECATWVRASNYDGCYLDLLGVAPLFEPYVNGIAIDPATNKPWTQQQWLQATAALATAVRKAVSLKVVMGNGVTDGYHYYNHAAPSKQLVDAMNGGIAESWLRTATLPEGAFPALLPWQQDVNMLGSVAAEGKPLLVMVKLWTSATAAQQAQWQNFAFASFLLGAGASGSSAFFFSPSESVSATTPCGYCSVNLGNPTGSYGPAGGVYRRPFANGLVLANPSATGTYTVPLGGTYYTQSRQPVTSVTMTPHTGVVLTKS